MALTNLGELKSSVADWLNREDLASVIPDFIKIAESRINSDYRSRVSATEYVISTTFASELQQNPIASAGVREIETLEIDGKIAQQVSWDQYVKELTNQVHRDGVWVNNNGSIYFSGWAQPSDPAPGAGGEPATLTLYGYEQTEFDLANDLSTTFFFNEHPQVYLYAVLTEAAVYLRDPEGMQMYQVRYDENMDKIQKEHKRQQVAGGMKVTSVGGDYYWSKNQ